MDVYPAYGLNTPAEAALAMRHSDGNLSTALVVEDFQRSGNITTIQLKDPAYPIIVNLRYKTYQEEDMIEAWTEITNNEKQAVTLTTFASAMLPIRRGDVWLSHFYGSWANEARLVEEPLTPGQKVIVNKDGTVSDLEVVEHLNSVCDQEVLRVLRLMPKWQAGVMNAKPCRTKVCIPVVFNF